MLFKVFNLIIAFALVFLNSPWLVAQEAEEKEVSSEPTAAEPVAGSPKQHPDAVEWYKRTQKLAALETRMKDETKSLQALISSKNGGVRMVKDEKGGQADILETIVKNHKNLIETYKKFEEEKIEVKYRYPGEGDLVERRYMSTRPPTLEQIEKEMGLEGELNSLSKRIETKYSKFVGTQKPDPKRLDKPESTIKLEDRVLDPNAKGQKKKLKIVR